MLKLYPDQAEVMDDLKAAMRRKKAILLQSPTGSGKTAMATDMVIAATGKGNKMLFSVPRRDLMTQTSKTFSLHKINHGFVASGRDFNPFAQVHIGMVDTMARRLKKWEDGEKKGKCPLPNVKLAVFDETHFGADALGRVIDHYKELGAWVIGLSATPWKLSGQGMGVWYDEMVCGKTIRWLMDNKRLSKYRYFYGRTREDFHAINQKSDKEIAEFMENKRVIIGDCVRDYRLRCMGRLHIVRCTSIKHSQITADAFRADGIPAAHVDGNTPDGEKYRIFMAFARRQILVLTFADLLNFGFDLSQATGLDVCVESCSDMKPSKSLAGQMQFWGRVLRYKDHPAIINDHVNNYIEHGLPCSDRIWTLDSRKTRDKGEPVPPTKQCPACMCVHPPAPKCPDCGKVYVIKFRKLEEVDGELEEMDIASMSGKQEELELVGGANEETLDKLITFAKSCNYKNPASWAAKELAKRINKEYV